MPSTLRTRELLLLTILTLVVVAVTTLVHLVHVAELAITRTEHGSRRTVGEVLAVASSVLTDATDRDDAIARLRGASALHALARSQLETTNGLLFVRMFAGDELVLCEPGSAGTLSMPETTFDDLRAAAWPLRLWRIYTTTSLITHDQPVQRSSVAFGRIECGTDSSIVRDRMAGSFGGVLIAAAIALALSFLASFVVARGARRPLRWLGEQIDMLREGQYEFEIDEDLDDEVRELAGRIRSLGAQMQSERLAMLGEKDSLVAIMNALEDAIALLARDGKIVFFNAAFEELVGVAFDDAVGQSIADVLAEGHPIGVLVDDARDGHGVRDLACRLPGGGRFERSLVTVQTAHDGKEASGIVVLVEDLGVLSTLNELVNSAASVEVGEARYAEVVHEVKNPLNSMNLNLELARRKLGTSSDVAPILDAIGREIRRLNDVVTTFLEFVRPLDLARVPVPIAPTLARLVRLTEAEARGGDVRVIVSPDVPDVSVVADEDPLFQVLLNLVKNAIEAMPDGGELRVETEVEPDAVALRFIDTGVGLADAEVGKVFDLYFTTKPGGSGIGLSIVSRIIDAFDGTIQFESALGQGSRVTIRLPRWQGSDREPAVEASEERR